MKIDVTKAIVGIVISLAVFGFIFPALFWLAAVNLDRLLGLSPLFSEPVGYILTAAALVIGLFWVLWSYSYLLFAGYGSPVEVFGRALHPTKQLVAVGPYAYTRNPMMLGYLWILMGEAFFLRSLSGIMLVFVIGFIAVEYLRYFEEPELVRRFGAEYEHYREHVPILIPSWRDYIKPESVLEA